MAASFLGPDVHHFPGEVKGVSQERGHSERDRHVTCFNVVVAEVLVDPEEEEFILYEGVKGAVGCPEHELACPDRETTLEQIGRAFFERNPQQSIKW